MPNVIEERNHSDPIRQHLDQFDQRTRTLSRLDHPNYVAPAIIRDSFLLSSIQRSHGISVRGRSCSVLRENNERDVMRHQ